MYLSWLVCIIVADIYTMQAEEFQLMELRRFRTASNIQRISSRLAHSILQVSSAFSQLLNLHNLTEEISNAQHERAVRMGEVTFQSKFSSVI